MKKFLGITLSSFTEEQFASIKYLFSIPITYKDTDNVQYPLVVYLHGAADRGADTGRLHHGLVFLGDGLGSQARAFRSKFPCFVYVPQCPLDDTWSGETADNVITTIEHLKATYPINPNRLYLIGYSMGGSGTYELASRYYDFNGQQFAGIVRLAGQSSFDHRVHDIIAKTSVWLHIGLRDSALRIEKAREAYTLLKTVHKNCPERVSVHRLDDILVTTSTLIIDNEEKVKLSEYSGMGHGINLLPFDDPAVLEWLFEKKL